MDGVEFIRQQICETQAVLDKISHDHELLSNISEVAKTCSGSLSAGNKVMLAGNGGSAADCQHFAGELVSRFNFDRPALSAIALTVDTSIITSIGNDYGYDQVFSRQISGIGRPGDVFIAYSTSGNSANIVKAVAVAKSMGITTVGFTGQNKGSMNEFCDIIIEVPSTKTPKIQEGHAIIGHTICSIIEQTLFNKDNQ